MISFLSCRSRNFIEIPKPFPRRLQSALPSQKWKLKHDETSLGRRLTEPFSTSTPRGFRGRLFCRFEKLEVSTLRCLLQLRADPSIKDAEGRTAAELAREEDKDDAYGFLKLGSSDG